MMFDDFDWQLYLTLLVGFILGWLVADAVVTLAFISYQIGANKTAEGQV